MLSDGPHGLFSYGERMGLIQPATSTARLKDNSDMTPLKDPSMAALLWDPNMGPLNVNGVPSVNETGSNMARGLGAISATNTTRHSPLDSASSGPLDMVELPNDQAQRRDLLGAEMTRQRVVYYPAAALIWPERQHARNIIDDWGKPSTRALPPDGSYCATPGHALYSLYWSVAPSVHRRGCQPFLSKVPALGMSQMGRDASIRARRYSQQEPRQTGLQGGGMQRGDTKEVGQMPVDAFTIGVHIRRGDVTRSRRRFRSLPHAYFVEATGAVLRALAGGLGGQVEMARGVTSSQQRKGQHADRAALQGRGLWSRRKGGRWSTTQRIRNQPIAVLVVSEGGQLVDEYGKPIAWDVARELCAPLGLDCVQIDLLGDESPLDLVDCLASVDVFIASVSRVSSLISVLGRNVKVLPVVDTTGVKQAPPGVRNTGIRDTDDLPGYVAAVPMTFRSIRDARGQYTPGLSWAVDGGAIADVIGAWATCSSLE
eukprot:jgi/Mesvir1/9484/Mv08667-RA.1